VAVSFPYSNPLHSSAHDFLHGGIESNRNAALVFEERRPTLSVLHQAPGREHSLDANKNQYFIATHNPTVDGDLGESGGRRNRRFATYYRNYETRVKLLTRKTWLGSSKLILSLASAIWSRSAMKCSWSAFRLSIARFMAFLCGRLDMRTVKETFCARWPSGMDRLRIVDADTGKCTEPAKWRSTTSKRIHG